MKALFLGGHPAVDFLNTSFAPDGKRIETIGDGRALLAWLLAARLVKEDEAAKLARRAGVRALDEAAAEARKMREWARQWLTSWRAGAREWRASLEALNQRLSRVVYRREVVAAGHGVEIIDRPVLDDTDALLALLAEQIASLIAREQAGLVKSCEGAGCTLWFVDRTRTHRRRFCSATACGNRAKVAAFRKRQRAAG
jgi:predicted RNA-binding Zn ribbon-like protein